MTEEITITYKPFIIGDLINTRKEKVTTEQLFGMMIMGYITKRVIINGENGDLIDIDQAPNLPYVIQAENYEHITMFNEELIVGYNSSEFIQGAIKICLLLGTNPSSMISGVVPDCYFGVMEIPNFTSESDGIVIAAKYLKYITTKEITNSIEAVLKNCFPSVPDVGIGIPCNLYVISTNPDFTDIIALIGAGKNVPEELKEYSGIYYIFDVCAHSNYRGKGFAKSLMIYMINSLINEGHRNFLLEVKIDNTVAYNLYTDLGFKKIKTISDSRGQYDALLLNISF